MNAIYTISQDLADVARGIKAPWFIVTAQQAVGVYTSRATARAAKSNGVEGTVVSLKEITLKIADVVEETPVEEIVVEETPVEEIVVEETPVEEVAPIAENADDHFNEVTEAEHAAHRAEMSHKSTATRPCRLVWDLADSMAGARRKDVIAAAEAKGVAYYTARTQYQLWAQVQKEMAAREKLAVK